MVVPDADEPKSDRLPICPHCGKDPITITARGGLQLGAFQCALVFCADCRKLVPVIVTGIEQPRVAPAKVFIPPS